MDSEHDPSADPKLERLLRAAEERRAAKEIRRARRASCTVCRVIPSALTIIEARGEVFPPAARALTQLRLASLEDFWECPECYQLFLWEVLSGAGVGDEETLTRLHDDESEFIQSLLDAGDMQHVRAALRLITAQRAECAALR